MKLLRLGVIISVLVTFKSNVYYLGARDLGGYYLGDRFVNQCAGLTCTVGMKLRTKPRYSSTSEEIFASVEKVVHGRGQSDESDPRYKFSSLVIG